MTADLLYRNVFDLCSEEDKKYSDEYILETYATDKDKGISLALMKYDGILFYQSSKIYTLEEADKRSIVLESLFDALETYDSSREASFRTHLTRIVSNLLSNAVRYSNTKGRKLPEGFEIDYLDREDTRGDELNSKLISVGEDDYRLTDIEFLDCVSVLSLEPLEYSYVQLVMQDSCVPRDSEACSELGLQRYQVIQIKKNIARKFTKALTK